MIRIRHRVIIIIIVGHTVKTLGGKKLTRTHIQLQYEDRYLISAPTLGDRTFPACECKYPEELAFSSILSGSTVRQEKRGEPAALWLLLRMRSCRY